jgi:hypothetical protein
MAAEVANWVTAVLTDPRLERIFFDIDGERPMDVKAVVHRRWPNIPDEYIPIGEKP